MGSNDEARRTSERLAAQDESDGIQHTILRVEARYELPASQTEGDLEEAVLAQFGSAIDSSFTETVDGVEWVVTAGEAADIEQADMSYLQWRNELDSGDRA